jgi:hypothetical protein
MSFDDNEFETVVWEKKTEKGSVVGDVECDCFLGMFVGATSDITIDDTYSEMCCTDCLNSMNLAWTSMITRNENSKRDKLIYEKRLLRKEQESRKFHGSISEYMDKRDKFAQEDSDAKKISALPLCKKERGEWRLLRTSDGDLRRVFFIKSKQ